VQQLSPQACMLQVLLKDSIAFKFRFNYIQLHSSCSVKYVGHAFTGGRQGALHTAC
jgi:hypothetical protein